MTSPPAGTGTGTRNGGPSGNTVVFLGRTAVAKIYAEHWRRRTEAEALSLLRAVDIAPRLLASLAWRGRAITVMTRVGARNPAAPVTAPRALELLHRVHRVPTGARPVGRLAERPGHRTWRDFLLARLSAYEERFREQRLGHAVRASSVIGALVEELPDRPMGLLHNDPHPGNFLAGDRAVHLVDWELSVIGDPLLDLVRFAWEWRLPPERWRATTGHEPDHPTVRAYRGVHALSRLMATTDAGGTPAAAALAERCLGELRDLLPRPRRNTTEVSMPAPTTVDVGALLDRALPGVRALGEPVPTTKGLFSAGWRVATDRGTLLVKVNSDPGAAQEHFERSADASRAAREHGVRVPRVLGFGTVDRLDGAGAAPGPHAYVIQEWLPGRDLEDHLEDASPAEAAAAFRDLGALVGKLHTIPYARGVAPEAGRDTRRLARDKLGTLLERHRERTALSEAELAETAATVRRLIGLFGPGGAARLTHHDLHLPNVLIGPDGTVSLIDLDFLRPGDPLEDFVKLELWGFPEPSHRAAFLQGYATTSSDPSPNDAEFRLHTYRILNALSYVHFFGVRDPGEVPEWTARLRELVAAARAMDGGEPAPRDPRTCLL
ncbi:phosphotransferase, partial [Streptomyces sp. URMC 123]|uniref:phosphotransferase n=1 Tax=Streptomyces sp. URMC 123 TaxID=3423403 RepID=UPI003F1C3375